MADENKRSLDSDEESRRTLWIVLGVIAALILVSLCCLILVFAWTFGDDLIEALGSSLPGALPLA